MFQYRFIIVYCGAPVLRMRGAVASDVIWYDMSMTSDSRGCFMDKFGNCCNFQVNRGFPVQLESSHKFDKL